MLTLKPLPSFKSNFSGSALRRPSRLNGVPGLVQFSWTIRTRHLVRAVISDDKALESAKKSSSVEQKNVDGSLASGSSVKEVRAVVTIRKKIKEKITEKIENQWELFINGIGQGILIQLISEEIDPGLFCSFLELESVFFFFFSFCFLFSFSQLAQKLLCYVA